MALMHARDGRKDLTGRAVAALKRIVVNESLLHRVQCAVGLRQALDRRDISPFGHNREFQARQHPPVVYKHCAGAALAVITTLFGSRETDMFPQGVEQGSTAVQRQPVLAPIDAQFHVYQHSGVGLCLPWARHRRVRGRAESLSLLRLLWFAGNFGGSSHHDVRMKMSLHPRGYALGQMILRSPACGPAACFVNGTSACPGEFLGRLNHFGAELCPLLNRRCK
jgi:hypothetical protein